MSNLKVHSYLAWATLCSMMLASAMCYGQTNKLDHLKADLQRGPTDREKLAIALDICEQHESLAADSMYYYAAMARTLAERVNDKEGIGMADFYLGTLLQKRGLLDSCRKLTERCLKELKGSEYNLRQKFEYLQSTLLVRSNEPKRAIEQFYSILRRAERKDDTLMQAISKNGIGWGYMEMSNYKEALYWFHQAINTGSSDSNERLLAVAFSNMAAVYADLKVFDSSEYYITKAIGLARKMENLAKIANGLNIQADLYMNTGREQMAEEPLKEALLIREKIGDPFYLVSDMYQLALYYATTGNAEKGIEISKRGIDICKQYNLYSKLPILYTALAESYKAAGDDKNYGNTLEKIIAIKDSVYQLNSTAVLAEMQAKYEVEKKENIIIRQKLSLLRKNYLFFGALMLLGCGIIIAVVLFRSYRKKEKIKLGHLMEEEKRIAVLAIQEAEEKERKRIAADLHDNLGAYAASISSNIDHITLHSIQSPANIPVLTELRNNSHEMVAQLSDTIWTLKKDALSLTAISDRLKVFMQKINASHPNMKMDVVEHIDKDVMLSPAQGFHLFRIVQEAINNAVKHSGADELIVTIESMETWKIIVEDNGKGMHGKKEVTQEGNGLFNMQNRADASGWNIEWVNGTGGGVKVIVEPSTTN